MSTVTTLRPRRPLSIAAGLLSVTAGLAGCSSSGSDTSAGMDSASAATAAAANSAVNLSNAEFVARTYLITPDKARTLGYRIDWQDRSDPTTSIVEVRAFGNAVFSRDAQLRIARYDGNSGARLWRVAMRPDVSEVYDLTYLPVEDQLYVGIGAEMQVYDAGTGVLSERQKLRRTLNTDATPAGRYLVYGSRDGMLVWHAYQVNAEARAYRLAPTVEVSPAFAQGYVVAVGRGGTVSSIRLGTGTRVWEKRALDEIVASPAAGMGAAFVSSLDQHIRCWPLGTDTPIPAWEYLTPAPLTDSPTLIGDAVYQQVPGHGLHRFVARPQNRPGGVLEWAAPEIKGNVAGKRLDTLLVWDADRRVMQIVDERTGDLIDEVELPSVTAMHIDDKDNGSILLAGTGGRVLRLVPTSAR